MSFPLSFTFIIKFICFIVMINHNKVSPQDFKTLPPKLLEEETELLDVKNYDSVNIIITKKSYYYGLYPELKESFQNEFPNNAVFATFSSDFILGACTNNNLLSYFNFNSFEEKKVYMLMKALMFNQLFLLVL